MTRNLPTVLLCLALGACASARTQKPAVCDGLHRRPANPNGSVLADSPKPAPAAAHPATAQSFAPCGGPA